MDKHEAAVVGGSLVSFLPGVTAQQRQSVQLAMLMAERVTRSDHEQGLVQDWYSYYRRRLQYLGWDAQIPEQVHWPSPERRLIADKALQAVNHVAGERHSSSLSLALSALLNSDAPLLHLEQRSRELGHFQLLPCAPSKAGYVDLVVYHEAGDRTLFSNGFLSRVLDRTRVRAELVRFNVRLFQQEFEARTRKNVEHVMQREILKLEL
ncbi:hypothetical protein F3J44_02850 [Pantoea sp. Tr-811]|uniref:hypothetical protein n=1 Tax=Pantoea sp. Tr-811 TaxID=2608361 RepID=UPI001424229F|nr:hypothetical protein [Pantoea sp. Tr-811]NIF25315.1 hypothetical protein [Pantoea sp. Tr-811]